MVLSFEISCVPLHAALTELMWNREVKEDVMKRLFIVSQAQLVYGCSLGRESFLSFQNRLKLFLLKLYLNTYKPKRFNKLMFAFIKKT